MDALGLRSTFPENCDAPRASAKVTPTIAVSNVIRFCPW